MATPVDYEVLVPEEESFDFESIESPPSPVPTEAKDHIAGQLAVISSVGGTGTGTLVDEFNTAYGELDSGGSPEQVIRYRLLQDGIDLFQDINALAAQQAGQLAAAGDTDQFAANARAVNVLSNTYTNVSEHSVALAERFVTSVGPDTTAEEQHAMFGAVFANIMADVSDSIGLNTDTATSFAGLMLFPDMTADDFQMFGYDKAQAQLVTLLNATSGPLKERIEALFGTVDTMFDAYEGNALKIVGELERIYGTQETNGYLLPIIEDLLTVPAGILGATRAMAKSASNMATVALVNKKAAAAATQQVLEGGAEVGRAGGVAIETAATSLLGLDNARLLDPAMIPGIADSALESVKQTLIVQASMTRRGLEEMRNTQRGLQSEDDVQAFFDESLANALDEFQTSSFKKWDVVNSHVVKVDDLNAQIRVTLKDPAGDNLVLKRDIFYPVNRVGGDAVPDMAALSERLLTPTTLLRWVGGDPVSAATKQGAQQARFGAYFSQVVRNVTKPLKAAEKSNLEFILREGAKRKETYTYTDLLSGNNPLRRTFKPAEAQAYAEMRITLDQLWDAQNWRARTELGIQGYKGATALNRDFKGTRRLVARPVEMGTVRNALPPKASVVDGTNGKALSLDEAQVLVETGDWQPMQVKGKVAFGRQSYDYMVVPKTKVGDMPTRVLNYERGYVPQINRNVRYLGVGRRTVMENGIARPTYQITHFFDNVADAKRFEEKFKEGQTRVKGLDEFKAVRADQAGDNPELAALLKAYDDEYEVNAFGGLGRAGRSKDPIYISSAEQVERDLVDPLQSITGAFQSVARNVPMMQLRTDLIRKLEENVKGVGGSFKHGEWRGEIDVKGDPNKARALTSFQEYAKAVVGIPTAQEAAYQTRVANLVDRLEKSILKDNPAPMLKDKVNGKWVQQKARNALLNHFTGSDPFALARTATFHTLLGSFNPAQLLVQAAGATVAFSLNPQKAASLMPRYLEARWLLHMEADDVGAVMSAAKNAKIDPGTVDVVREFKRSGLWDSLKSNPDLEMARFGAVVDPSELQRNLSDASLFFYREGETFSRLYSWLEAHSHVKATLGRGLHTKSDWNQVFDRATRNTFNLTAANKAYWQSGALSVPTQFMQITAKFIEQIIPAAMPKVLGGRATAFSPGEARAVLGGSLGLFGAAALPFGQSNILPAFLEHLGVDELSPAGASILKGGFTDYMTELVTGVPADVATRTSTMYGLQQFLTRFETAEDVGDFVLGASGVLPERLLTMVKSLSPVAVRLATDFESLDGDDFTDSLMNVASVASTFSNANKARLWANTQQVYSLNTGAKIFDMEEVENWSGFLWAQALGFTPTQLSEFYLRSGSLYSKQQDRRETSKALSSYIKRHAAMVGNSTSPEELETLNRKLKHAIGVFTVGYSEAEVEDVMTSVRQSFKRGSEGERTLIEAADRWFKYQDVTAGLITSPEVTE